MDNFVQLSDVLKFGDNLENGQNFNEIPKNSRGVARGGGWTLWEGVTHPPPPFILDSANVC